MIAYLYERVLVMFYCHVDVMLLSLPGMCLKYSDLIVIALIARGIRRGVTLSGIRAMLVYPTVLLCRRSATVVFCCCCCCC